MKRVSFAPRWITVHFVAVALACAGCSKSAGPPGTGETNDDGGAGGAPGAAGAAGTTTGAAGIGGGAGTGAAGAAGTTTGAGGIGGGAGTGAAATGGTGAAGSGGAGGAGAAGTNGAGTGGSEIGGRSGTSGGKAGGGGSSAGSSDAGTADGGGTCSLPSIVGFRRDVEPFLTSKCGGGNGCHVIDSASTTAAGGYDHAYDWITAGAHSSSCPGTPTPKRFEVVLDVIAAANPAHCSRSRIMPPRNESGSNLREPLTPCETATLKAWLEEPLVTQKHRVDDTDPEGTPPFPMPPFN
jgi:hypothetical protein